MNRLVEEIIKPFLTEMPAPKITKIIGVYGGRFQPFGPHHLKTYKWLEKQVDEAYITTSNIKQPPRHPMNFKEKVRHMSKMGIPSNRIIQEKSPYVAKNLMSKFDSETTAVVYIFGAKDKGRLSGGKYFQDYKKNKRNLSGHKEHGYVLTAPHISISVAGQEVSGTSMRTLLGAKGIDDSVRQKLFKKMFGYYNDGLFKMMTNKFKKLFEAKGDEWDKENNPNTDGDNIKFDFVPEPEGEDDILMDEDINIKKRDGKDSGDYRTYTAPEDSDIDEPYKRDTTPTDGKEEKLKKDRKHLKKILNKWLNKYGRTKKQLEKYKKKHGKDSVPAPPRY